MQITVNVVCYKSKTLANGEHPLVIRVCKDGKKKYQSIGMSVKPKFWDFEKNQSKRNYSNREAITKLILKKFYQFIRNLQKNLKYFFHSDRIYLM